MPSRRCSLHGINYHITTYHCPVCRAVGLEDDDTAYLSDVEPDEDAAEQAAQLIRAHDEEQEAQGLVPNVPVANVTVRDGQMWVSAWDVFPAVGTRLNDTDLFRIGKQVFEVLGYVHDKREYLVRPFSMTLSDEDLARLSG